MMPAAVHDYRRIWSVAAVRRSPGMFKFLCALLLLVLAASLVFDQMASTLGLPPHLGLDSTTHVLLACAGVEFDLLWSTAFMPGSMLLNSAANARLLPRQRRRLRQMAVGGWVLGNAALTWGVGHPGVFPLAALWSLTMGLGAAGQRWAMPASIVLPVFAAPLLQCLPQPVTDILTGSAGVAVASALVLAVGLRLLVGQYEDGGDRLLERSAALALQAHRLESKGEVKESWLTSWTFRLLYLPALRRAGRRRDPSAMLMHAMGPWGHWSMMGSLAVLAMSSVLFFSVVPGLVSGNPIPQEKLIGMALGLLVMMPLAVAFCTFPLRHQIGKRQGEQALLRLSPLAGNAALLNHRLADGLLKAGAQQWLILSVPFCLLALAFGGAEALARELALCCVGGQMALAAVMDDFSRPTPHRWYWKMTALVTVEIAVTLGLGWRFGFPGWPWLTGLAVAAGAVQVGQGWQRMRSAPPAFPALRFAAHTEVAKGVAK
jgi:hypothetical protein